MSGGKKSWYEVICEKHGTYSHDTGRKVIRVSLAKGKHKQGCPHCKKEANEAKEKNNDTKN